MGVCAGEAGELVAGFEGDTDFALAGELNQGVEADIVAVTRYGDVVELAGAGANGLFDGVQAVQNFHR